MKIAIRADGGSNIGMGHIMRTLVLAREIAKYNEVFYICKTNNSECNEFIAGINKIREEGFQVITINVQTPTKDIINIKADCLITDSYEVDENYFNTTANYFKYTCYIDDLCIQNYNVNILINQNINAMDLEYKITNETKFFLGSKYVMLRDEFRNIKQRNIRDNVEDILITVGGGDPVNATQTILNCVKETSYNYHVVIGSSFEKDYVHKILGNKSDNIHFYFNANMYELMNKCDLAISGAGSTLYELAACGIPTLGFVLADNQLGVAKKMHEMGILIYLGWHYEFDKNKLICEIDKLCKNTDVRRRMSYNAQQIVDVKGIEKIAKYINSLSY